MALATEVYSLDFVRDLARWSIWTAIGVATIGGLITRDVHFVITCLIAGAIDVWMLVAIEQRGRESIDGTTPGMLSYGALAGLVGGRLVVKSVLLVAAVLLPTLLSFWGMVAGVLVVDTTVVLVGGPVAATRTFHHSREQERR